MGFPTSSWTQRHGTEATGLSNTSTYFFFLLQLPPPPSRHHHLVPRGLSPRLPALLLLLCSLLWGTHVASIRICTQRSPRSPSSALTFHFLFSPLFPNVYKIHRLDISLPSKTNMSKPDCIISPPPPQARLLAISPSATEALVPPVPQIYLPPAPSAFMVPFARHSSLKSSTEPY